MIPFLSILKLSIENFSEYRMLYPFGQNNLANSIYSSAEHVIRRKFRIDSKFATKIR